MSRLTCMQSAQLEQILNATSTGDIIRELALIAERRAEDGAMWRDDKPLARQAKRLNAFANTLND